VAERFEQCKQMENRKLMYAVSITHAFKRDLQIGADVCIARMQLFVKQSNNKKYRRILAVSYIYWPRHLLVCHEG
jgi:hypothetical protein